MEQQIEIKSIATYGGHTMKPNGVVDVVLKFDYSELTNAILLQQLLNNDISIIVKKHDEPKPFKLGTYKIKNTNISGDGCSSVKFFSSVDFTESDNLNKLVTTDQFRIKCNATVEIEENEEKEGE